MTIAPTVFDNAAAELLAMHKRQPEITAQDYAKSLVAALGKAIAGRRKIYLDTKFWVLLRDAAMGRPREPAHTELLELLRRVVAAGLALCPIGDASFVELIRQSDPLTRVATAQLMDELSLGVALISEQDRVMMELSCVLSADGAKSGTEMLDHMVWVKICFVLGFPWPVSPNRDQAANRLLQKVIIDELWKRPLTELIETVGEPPSSLPGFDQTAELLNRESAAHAHEARGMEKLFLAEIAGTLSVFKDHLVKVVQQAYVRETGTPPMLTDEGKDDAARRAHSLMVNCFREAKDKMAKRVPSLYINAMCHAACRLNRSKKLKGNDLVDFHHAMGAVAYCNAFFTDGPLRALLTAKHVALDKEFGRTILSDEDGAVEYLQSVLATDFS